MPTRNGHSQIEAAVKVLPAIGEVSPEEWDAGAGSANPFLGHRFLSALEDSGAVIAPALLIAVGNMTQRRRVAIGWFRSLVIVAAAALTFSAVTYAALALSLLLVALRRRSGARPIWIAAGLLLATAAYVYLPDIRLRVDDLVALYNSEDMASTNFSLLALHKNEIVPWKQLAAPGHRKRAGWGK